MPQAIQRVLRCPFALRLSRADGAAYIDGGAHGKADDDDGQHVHELASDGDRRDDCGAVELSCDEKVRETVEGLEKAGDHVGNGEADQGTEYIPSGEILLHVKILPESTECFLRRGLPRRDRKIVAFTPASCNHGFRASAQKNCGIMS